MSLACKTRFSRRLTVGAYTGLLLLFTLWYLLLSPAKSEHPWVIWLVHLLPLLAFLPVILSGNARGHAWLCFMLLLYFLEAVIASLVPPTRWLGIIESLLLVALFCSAMMYARWKSRLDRTPNDAG